MSILVSNLTKTFGQQRALYKISFEVNEGEILGFLGPNGAGKSTTMKIATCFLPPSDGSVKVCGYDVMDQADEVKKLIGYLPEHNPLYLDMYVREYLQFIGKIHGVRSLNLKKRIDDIIQMCGLSREQNKKIEALSKGYRQRVGLAQALIHDPKVLILDEPTTGLDPNQIVEIRNLIKQIGKDKTVIFSSHIMQEVQALCDRVIVINKGRLVANDQIGELKLQKVQVAVVRVEFSEAVDIEQLKSISGVIKVTQAGHTKYTLEASIEKDVRPAIFQFAADHGLTLVGLQQEEVTMENIFRELTKSDDKA